MLLSGHPLKYVCYLLMGVGLCGLGFYGLAKRRPVILSARWPYAWLTLPFIAWLANEPAVLFHPTVAGFREWPLPSVLCLTVLAVAGWMQDGYLILGATDASLHRAVEHAFEALGLEFQELAEGVFVPSEELDIDIVVTAWGASYMTVLEAQGRKRLAQLARQMSRAFAESPHRAELLAYAVLSVLGTLFFAVPAALWQLLRDQ